ncbi:hypothetical protein SAMN05444266_104196 [Chitinophaga jiangningensis]|uniref:Uncharacterized protein n=1 Tax=Chitinophaga jiangningensis TaxID=1419482 RepID=A0A1M7C560_9BACT|nr:hypothetical protein [Chitinophaga jiangningensis]SHL62297.1 hypothetical protein SAMN05444266_104196 [Chitinophaga jiangningensis]
MRFINVFTVAVLAFMIASCMDKKEAPAIRPFAFNDSGMRVITTVINEKDNEVAMLYGNKAAFDNRSQPEALFKLVTYREQDNKFWFGSYINGELLRVETVNMQPTASGQAPAYSVDVYNQPAFRPADAAARTNFIQTLDRAWYPCDPY